MNSLGAIQDKGGLAVIPVRRVQDDLTMMPPLLSPSERKRQGGIPEDGVVAIVGLLAKAGQTIAAPVKHQINKFHLGRAEAGVADWNRAVRGMTDARNPDGVRAHTKGAERAFHQVVTNAVRAGKTEWAGEFAHKAAGQLSKLNPNGASQGVRATLNASVNKLKEGVEQMLKHLVALLTPKGSGGPAQRR